MSRSDYSYAYLIVQGEEAVFIDNNTNQAVPLLLKALEDQGLGPEQVKYIIVTHVHLDHAGGTSLLLSKCPNAKVLAHPRAVNHLADPTKLLESSRQVYGQSLFSKLYGEILPIPPSKIVGVEDAEVVTLGERKLEFIHTPGHAKHHMVVYDPGTRSIFTGDAFGLSYRTILRRFRIPVKPPSGFFKAFNISAFDSSCDSVRDMLFPSSSPIDFQPVEAHAAIDKIVRTGARRAYLTHGGVWEDLPMGGLKMHYGIQRYQDMLLDALLKMKQAQIRNVPIEEAELRQSLEDQMNDFFVEELIKHGIDHESSQVRDLLRMDLELNAQGLLVAAKNMFLVQGGLFYK